MNYERHPLSAAWPNMQQEELEALVESIQMHGLRDPIVLLEDLVLDGWHRYTACLTAGMQPVFTVFDGDDPIAYISDKHNRRSLTLTQRMTALMLMNEVAARGRPSKEKKGAPGAPLTSGDIARQAGGSVRTAKQVKAALTTGRKEVVEGMKDGTLSAKRASEIAKLPAKEQVKAIKAAPKPEVEDIHYVGPSQEEIDAAIEDTKQDMETLHKLLESDDKLATLNAENEKLRAELAVVKLSRDGYMNRSNELIDRIKWLKKKLAKAEGAQHA
jgi:hypothetical protein